MRIDMNLLTAVALIRNKMNDAGKATIDALLKMTEQTTDVKVLLTNRWETKKNKKHAIGFDLTINGEIELKWCEGYQNGAQWDVVRKGVKFTPAISTAVSVAINNELNKYKYDMLPVRVFGTTNGVTGVTFDEKTEKQLDKEFDE